MPENNKSQTHPLQTPILRAVALPQDSIHKESSLTYYIIAGSYMLYANSV